jgi:hypothetical protein
MKKVIKLTESDLVKIVKRVIEEQITDKGPIPAEVKKINIPDDFKTQLKVNFGKEETPKSFIDKIKNSPVGMAGFHIETEGWKFPIYPVYAQLNDNFKISFEPLNKERGLYLLKWKKSF